MVIISSDNIILKPIAWPSAEEFSEMLNKIQNEAKKAGITEQDIQDAIKEVRKKNANRT